MGHVGDTAMQVVQRMQGMQRAAGGTGVQRILGIQGILGTPAAGVDAGRSFWGGSQGTPIAPHACRTFCTDPAALGSVGLELPNP